MSRFSFSPHRHNPTFHDIQGFFLRAAFFFPRKTEWGGGGNGRGFFFYFLLERKKKSHALEVLDFFCFPLP